MTVRERTDVETWHPDDAQPLRILNEVRTAVSVMQSPPWNRFLHSFSHIFARSYE